MLLVCIIVATVVGGVVGSRNADNSKSSSSSSSSSSPGPSSSSSPSDSGNQGGTNQTSSASGTGETKLQSIKPNSRLSATGWSDGNGYYIDLFYQGPDDQLRFSYYTGYLNYKWSELVALGFDVVSGSLLASCPYIANQPVGMSVRFPKAGL